MKEEVWTFSQKKCSVLKVTHKLERIHPCNTLTKNDKHLELLQLACYVHVHDMMYSHYIVLPLMIQDWLYVCGEMSWWRGHALVFGNSFINLPCTNSDRAQQFFTRLEYGGVACIGASAAGCVSSSFCSNSRMRSFSCSSAEILWANDSQVNAHWLSMRHSWRGWRVPDFWKSCKFLLKWCII